MLLYHSIDSIILAKFEYTDQLPTNQSEYTDPKTGISYIMVYTPSQPDY